MSTPIDKLERLKDYQRRADEASKRAAAATSEEERDGWQQVADGWLALIETTIKASGQNPKS